jgi:signal transduction histidine kinase
MTEPRAISRLHDCLRAFPAAAVELSADGRVLDSNGRLEALLRREIINHDFAELLDDTSQAKWQRVLASRVDPGPGAIWELVLQSDNILELRSFAAVWGKDGGEDLLWLVEYARDLRMEPLYEELSAANSDVVQTQRELAKEQARLARALESEQAARAQAERAIRVRDGVLAVVAHDLRNPLGRIATTVALLAEETLSPEDRAQMLRVLQRTASGMQRLVQDLLDAASIEGGRLSIDRDDLDVVQLLADICTAYGPLGAQRGVSIECQHGDGVPVVLADRGRVTQVLNNLLDNAIRLTSAGGRIVLRADNVDGAVRLSVSDTGPGIEAEEMPHLFDRFWQGKRSRRGSSGLGLAIAKGIVEAHNGRIWVDSKPGEGSTFFILLPRGRTSVDPGAQ